MSPPVPPAWMVWSLVSLPILAALSAMWRAHYQAPRAYDPAAHRPMTPVEHAFCPSCLKPITGVVVESRHVLLFVHQHIYCRVWFWNTERVLDFQTRWGIVTDD